LRVSKQLSVPGPTKIGKKARTRYPENQLFRSPVVILGLTPSPTSTKASKHARSEALALEPMHGYGVVVRIEQISRGVFPVNAGSMLLAFSVCTGLD
jgi:hypothetical protein